MTNLTKNISHDRLKSLLEYCEEDGLFYWKKSVNSRARLGGIAGSINGEGYREIRVDNVTRRSARLAFFYMTGKWPEQVDHIDGNRSNDRWVNLREVDTKENARNQRVSTTSTSGIIGVRKRGNRWAASITVDGENIHLGNFKDKDKAILARKQAEFDNDFHENHGT